MNFTRARFPRVFPKAQQRAATVWIRTKRCDENTFAREFQTSLHRRQSAGRIFRDGDLQRHARFERRRDERGFVVVFLNRPNANARRPSAGIPQTKICIPLIVEKIHEGDRFFRNEIERIFPATWRVQTNQRRIDRAKANTSSNRISHRRTGVQTENVAVRSGDHVARRIDDRREPAEMKLGRIHFERQAKLASLRPRLKRFVMDCDLQIGERLVRVENDFCRDRRKIRCRGRIKNRGHGVGSFLEAQ